MRTTLQRFVIHGTIIIVCCVYLRGINDGAVGIFGFLASDIRALGFTGRLLDSFAAVSSVVSSCSFALAPESSVFAD